MEQKRRFFTIIFETNIKEQKLTLNIDTKGNDDMISMKIYKQGNDLLIGACDEKLIGKIFKEGKFQIDVSKEFYDGERISPEVLKKYLEDATIANLVGKDTIKCAVELGLVDPECVIKIKGIPHAQLVRML